MSAPRISVVVPTYERCSSVTRLLRALRRQTLSPEEFEVIVVVDGSRDGTRKAVEAFEAPFPIVTLWQSNRGRATACNVGIRRAGGEFVVLLDDDMEPSDDFLREHLSAHAEGDRLGILGAVPIPVTAETPPIVDFIADKFNRHLEELANGKEIKFRSFYSGNFSIRRCLLLEAGLFDERYRHYGNEDTELALRLAEIGVTLRYDPRALAVQHYEKDFAGLARDHLGKGRTAVVTARKHEASFGAFDVASFRRTSEKWGERSLKWKLLRSALLFASRYSELPSLALLRLVHWIERFEPRDLRIYYLFSLDFFYWRGVEIEVATAVPPGSDRDPPGGGGQPGGAGGPIEASGSGAGWRVGGSDGGGSDWKSQAVPRNPRERTAANPVPEVGGTAIEPRP